MPKVRLDEIEQYKDKRNFKKIKKKKKFTDDFKNDTNGKQERN